MEFINADLACKLVSVGYTSIETLPDKPNSENWNLVKARAALSNPDLIRLKNCIFPPVPGGTLHSGDMSAIQSDFVRAKLISAGYTIMDTLPNVRSSLDWGLVRKDASLSTQGFSIVRTARCSPVSCPLSSPGLCRLCSLHCDYLTENVCILLQTVNSVPADLLKELRELKVSILNEITAKMEKLEKQVTFKLDEIMRNNPPASLRFKESKSNTDHGTCIYESLRLYPKGFEVASEGAGPQAMSPAVIAQAAEMCERSPRPHSRELVALYTEGIMQIMQEVHPDLRVVNSECSQWLRYTTGHRQSGIEPALFASHFSLVEYLPPCKNAPTCSVPRLFGKFADWNSRSSIHSIWDATWEIDIHSFGEICKNLQNSGEECFDHNGVAVMLRGILFDVHEFWMIASFGNTIAYVVKCRWGQSGSRQRLKDFLAATDPWLHASAALCAQLGVAIEDHSTHQMQDGAATGRSAYLGSGATGRVVKVSGGAVLKIAVGRRSDTVEDEYRLMLKYHGWEAIRSLVFPIVEGSYRSGTVDGVRYAGFLLAREGQKIDRATYATYANYKHALAVALCGLHVHDVLHGDPRIENVLLLDGDLKWIDFREVDFVTTKVCMRRDVSILVNSLGGSCVAIAAEVENYVNNPCVENLEKVLMN